MTLPPGTRLGPYEVIGPVGAGGMGEVYKARDTRLDRTVALKVLSPATAAEPGFRERFEREARVVARLDHPHICAIHDVGHEGGVDFLVMQYLDGETLAARLARGRLPVGDVLRLGIEVAEALDRAHREGVVHRDLKPANVMLTRTGARLLDFGIARTAPVVSGRAGADDTATIQRSLTVQGTIVGTIQYMAPEQLRGHEPDPRSDLFSLGVLLYEALTGRGPFQAPDAASLIGAILERQPAAVGTLVADVPPRLDRAIATCLEKDPAERWQSARDLLRELRWIAEEQAGADTAPVPLRAAAGRRPRRRVLVGSAIALAALSIVAAAAWLRDRGAPAPAGPPVIVLMDSQHPQRVYDDRTRAAGGTNADDLTDVLRDLPVSLIKENTGPTWHREDQILRQRPALVVVHRSCFYDATLLGGDLDQEHFDRLYPFAADKFETFMGYVGLGSPATRFLVYSRRSWATPQERDAWIATVEQRFPQLKGRLTAFMVPLDRPTFRNAATAGEIRQAVVELLQQAGTRPRAP